MRISRLLTIFILLFFVSISMNIPFSVTETASAVTVTIQPSVKDIFINEEFPDFNFQSQSNDLWVRSINNLELRSFVEFSMSSVPSGSTVESALLGLYVEDNVLGTDIRIQARRVVSSWTETGITWNNQPTTTVIDSVTIDSGTAEGLFIEWNITAMVSLWINGTLNEGVVLDYIFGGASEGLIQFPAREWPTDSVRPRLIVIYTGVVIEPSYLVYLAGSITNLTSEVGAVGTEFNVRLENTGGVELVSVDLELYSHVPSLVQEIDLFNIAVSETRNHQFVYTHGLSEGSYSWQLQAHYQGDTEYWNFTLYVGPSGSLTQIFVASSTLQPQQIDTDSTATLIISINNVGGQVVAFRTQATSRSLLVSPTTAQQIILQPGTGDTTEFVLFPQEDGLFFVDALVTPINQTTGAAIGSSFFTRHLLIVRVASSVTTFSADDIGVTDAILQGKINSLGGFDSATVYFTFWETGTSVDNAFIVPPNKQVVGFISDFRVWVGDLLPETQYSYEFRMQVGPVSNPTIFFGGIVNFTTTETFSDPFTAARNGLAEFLGIDSISMGVILGTLAVVLSIVAIALVAGDRLEGMAQALAIGLGGFAIASIFFSIGYLPLWVLVFLAVIMAAVIIGLPTFQKGAAANE